MHAQQIQTAIVLLLCLATVAAYVAPGIVSLASALRKPEETAFLLLALAAALYAYPSSAAKSGGGETNPPPISVKQPTGRINLFYHDLSGRLVPFDARIKEVTP